jgi:hypothetical protein
MIPYSNMNELAAGNQFELSVVMPCLNERETVGVCVCKSLASLRKTGILGEVIHIAPRGTVTKDLTQ